ncbi:MAG: class I SAM-dependent methyltransferase [Bacteroidia bacterium]|nr:class I SAM-dependent methyltransferase [Bacteroidia bacterium]
MTPLAIREQLLPLAQNAEMREYIRVHAKRFGYILGIVTKLRTQISAPSIRILDVGPSFFTKLLMDTFTGDEIWSLGFMHEEALGGHLSSEIAKSIRNFISFDLNDAYFRPKWVTPPPCDLIVAAEVIEHLYTSPVQVFRFFNSFLTPGGYLVVSTPNAVTLRNRILICLGKNPFELIRETRDNPGHYREYTGEELVSLGQKAELHTVALYYENYFEKFSFRGKLVDAITRYLLPHSFRTGLTIVYQKKSTDAIYP